MHRDRRWHETVARYACVLIGSALCVIALTDGWRKLVVAVALVALGVAAGVSITLSSHDDRDGHYGWCWNAARRGPQHIDRRRGCAR